LPVFQKLRGDNIINLLSRVNKKIFKSYKKRTRLLFFHFYEKILLYCPLKKISFVSNRKFAEKVENPFQFFNEFQ